MERNVTNKSLPMINRRGLSIPLDVLRRLSETDQRVVNGVLNPSDTILPESRVGDRGAIQLTINEFESRGNAIRERILDSKSIADAKELFQEAADIDAVIDILEQQRVKEEVLNEQENDVTRLEKVKKWFKENWAGASVLAVTVASLITTIVVGARNVILKGAELAKEFAKKVRDAIKKIGPWAAGVANFVYNILKTGFDWLGWLAENLWILAVGLVILIMEMRRK